MPQPNLDTSVPFGRFQYVDVVFNATANGNTDITHLLRPSDPNSVRYQVVSWSFATAPVTVPTVYIDTSATRRPWGVNYIVLRCNMASAIARLLLFLER